MARITVWAAADPSLNRGTLADPAGSSATTSRVLRISAELHRLAPGDLAAKVHQERTVGDLAERDALDAAQLFDDLVGVGGRGGGHGDADVETAGVG
ncbi:hypothetical protein AQJ91_35135 [Streptomyces dysideae]|uniref:Uncharacterized protein n=1 Tax=Streptomyces dysideae TaxID=909626 RepID=A0A101UTF3_9ACTN|nr:hypothetical protein AQJ91_35135 [Streptomyces dysideae]